MRCNTIQHRSVGSGPYTRFAAKAETQRWGVGLVVEEWGLRILCIYWHICIHFGEE